MATSEDTQHDDPSGARSDSGASAPRADRGTRGLLWSHLLASLCGGLVLAGVLLGFGVIGKQRTVTVPIDNFATPPATPGNSAQTSDTARIFARDNPGVVQIRTAVGQRFSSPFVPGVEPRNSTSTGSGFLVAQRGHTGYILTTYHEIAGGDTSSAISVVFDSAITRTASVVRQNPNSDVALLEVKLQGLPTTVAPLSVGNAQDVRVGDSTLTIADPFGLERTLGSGIVASLQRQLTSVQGTAIDNVIQTDASPTPGASGSPLLDAAGQVIGVNDEIQVSSGGSSYMVGFAVPINTVKDLVIPTGVL